MISTITAPIKKSRRQLRILPDFLLTYPTEWQCRLVHTDCVKLQFKTNRSHFWPAAADPITYCLWHFILEQTSGGCNSGGRAFSVDTKLRVPCKHTNTRVHVHTPAGTCQYDPLLQLILNQSGTWWCTEDSLKLNCLYHKNDLANVKRSTVYAFITDKNEALDFLVNSVTGVREEHIAQ